MALDLKKNNYAETSEAGYEFELRDPATNEGLDAFITVFGEQSKTVKAYSRKKFAEFRAREMANKRRGKDEDMTLEEAEELSIESAVVRIKSWRGIAEGKTEVEFNRENATRILTEHPWIKEAVMEESSQLLNFRSK